MQAINENFYDFLTAGSYKFVIPIYQRSYSWKPKNCKRLYEDIAKVINGEHSNHYFGSITIQPSDKKNLIIIDGQQRLTTICLFLIALRDVMNKHKSTQDYPQVFCNDYYDDEKEISVENSVNPALRTAVGVANLKLQSYHRGADHYTYSHLFQNDIRSISDPEVEMNTTMILNYELFYGRLESDLIDPNKSRFTYPNIVTALSNLLFAKVTLNESDNPQVVFDCMNSTGLPLTPGDNIRNYLLMNISSEEIRNDRFNNYWIPIIGNIIPSNSKNPGDDITEFIRTWLKCRYETKITNKEVYELFKMKLDRDFSDGSHLSIFQELLAKSNIYRVITTGKGSSSLSLGANEQEANELDGIISRLNYLGIKQFHCFAMSILSACRDHIIPVQQVVEILSYFESYVFRGIVCNYRANKYESIFPRLFKKMRVYINSNNQATYTNALTNILATDNDMEQKNILFPDDDTFINALHNIKYTSKGLNKVPRYILVRLNSYLTQLASHAQRELPSLDILDDTDNITIEHIFPQTPDNSWKNYLGNDYNATELLLNTLGNLTLTGYNSTLSNSIFTDKVAIYRDSEYALNKSNQGLDQNIYQPIADYETWGSQNIVNRTRQIANLSINIWRAPNINNHANRIDNSLTLNDSVSDFSKKRFRAVRIELPNRDPVIFQKDNALLPMNECFNFILRTLHSFPDYNLGIISMDDEFKSKVKNIIKFKNNEPTIIPPTNNSDKLESLKTIFDFYEIDYINDDPVTFYLPENN